ncbi:hypothetical protein [Actinomadura sp. 21ATH]|uniref:hypothetical protein n=1 Tax=Actinomadura sp. 21ATH TaxID=1735444 RepID=UPI0035C13E60
MVRGPTIVSVFIGARPFVCTVCQASRFRKRRMYLRWRGEFVAPPLPPATGLVCTGCGYLHMFYNDDLRFEVHSGRL